MPDKNILDVIVLVQNGKIVAEPSVDNYQVHPSCAPGAPEGELAASDSQAVLRALKAKYPTCAFTWFSDLVDAASCRVSDPVEKRQDAASTEDTPPIVDAASTGDVRSSRVSESAATGKTRKPKQEPKS